MRSGLSDSVQRANNAMEQIARPSIVSSRSIRDPMPPLHRCSIRRDAYIDELSQPMDIRVVQGDLNQINVFTNSGVQLVGTNAGAIAVLSARDDDGGRAIVA